MASSFPYNPIPPNYSHLGNFAPYSQAPSYRGQPAQERVQGFGDDLNRHEGEDNHNDMKNGDKVGGHLVVGAEGYHPTNSREAQAYFDQASRND